MYSLYFLIFENIKQLRFSKFLDLIFPAFKIYVISRFFKGIIDLLNAKTLHDTKIYAIDLRLTKLELIEK